MSAGTELLLRALGAGPVSAESASALGVRNLKHLVYTLRKDGHCITTQRQGAGSTTVYKLEGKSP